MIVTLDEIKEKYAKSLSDKYKTRTWQSLITSNSTRSMEHHHNAVAKLYAKAQVELALRMLDGFKTMTHDNRNRTTS